MEQATFENSSCQILDGKLLSQHFVQQAKMLVSQKKIVPKLAVILVGENPASQVYVNNKIKLFREAGFESQSYFYKGNEISEQALIECIEALNHDEGVHGILIQLPLPAHFNQDKILSAISAKKDVDGFLAQNIGALACGHFSQAIACTPFGVMALLYSYGIPVEGRHAVVVGRSNIVGKPMGLLLLGANATVTFAHSKTSNLKEICQSADILIAAAGKPELITKDFVKPGCVVVDVGIHKKSDGKLCGDVHQNAREVASAMSPVPGGVGPMTIAMLMVNTSLAAWNT
ncbi:MAG: bifunctional 5,10-methylenetetrahydrofolate dehydrogenase/5,10-methenyltetrahydrofolate cyclohydrolase [Bdellovibrionota bacterium]